MTDLRIPIWQPMREVIDGKAVGSGCPGGPPCGLIIGGAVSLVELIEVRFAPTRLVAVSTGYVIALYKLAARAFARLAAGDIGNANRASSISR